MQERLELVTQLEEHPTAQLDLVVDPFESVNRFEEGLLAWSEMARDQLVLWRPSDSTGVTEFLASNSRSTKGRSSIDVIEGRDRLVRLLNDDIESLELGHRPTLLRNGDSDGFEPTTVEDFISNHSDEMWLRAGEALLRRKTAPRVGYSVSDGTLSRSVSTPRPDRARPTVAPLLHLDAAEMSSLLSKSLVTGSSAIFFKESVPRLGRPVWGVNQQTMERTQKRATGVPQRTRIFVCARRLRVATELGEISFGSSHVLWTLRRVAREALIDLEHPGYATMSDAEKHNLRNGLYQESRRSVGHILFMLEQLFEAGGVPVMAERFGALLDELPSAPRGGDE